MANHLDELNQFAVDFRTKWEKLDANVPDSLFHYSSNDTLLGVIENKQIWATNILYLNDKMELRHAIELLKRIAREIEGKYEGSVPKRILKIILDEEADWSNFVELFVFCLSENRDLLSQWRGYGAKYKSMALKLDATALKLNSDLDPYNFTFLHKVVYDPAEQQALIKEYLESWLAIAEKYSNSNISDSFWGGDFKIRMLGLYKLLARFKDPSWSEEKEWRLVFVRNETLVDVESEKRHYRTSHHSLIPFIKRNPFEGDRIPVQEIILPQHEFQVNNESAVRSFMMDKGYNGIEISFSKIPIVY